MPLSEKPFSNRKKSLFCLVALPENSVIRFYLKHWHTEMKLPYFGGFVVVSFSGHCVLARHFHGWIMAGLFVSLSVARCFRDAARTAPSRGPGLSRARLSSYCWKPSIMPHSVAWPRETSNFWKVIAGVISNWNNSMHRSDLKDL